MAASDSGILKRFSLRRRLLDLDLSTMPDAIGPRLLEGRCRRDDVSDNEEDFAAMFEASIKATRLVPGQVVEGKIVAIGDDVAFVDVGSKGEATIALDELRDDDGALEVGVGDRVQATLVSSSGGLTLSRKLQRGAATAQQLEDAFRSGLPVEGKVERAVKAGYEVSIARQRAFCPMSQIDLVRTADPAVHEGRVYTFRILEYHAGGRKFVVSRRAVLEEEQKARAEQVRRTIVPGAVMTGRVVSVRPFGAFIDLGGGVQGLLHVSEMGWSRVADVGQVVQPGESITVKVLRVDDANRQIALGLKQLSDDPWSAVPQTYEAGQVRRGRVTRLAEFGAFVELEPGIEGLAHVSTFAPEGQAGSVSRQDLRRMFPVGSEIEVVVQEVDAEHRRIGLSVTAVAAAREAEEVREYTERRDDAEPRSLGSLADKLRGALGTRKP
jgi:small subunit ribosomal protein S1